MKSGAEHPSTLTSFSASPGNLTGHMMPRASVGIDNLRAVVIVMVLIFHAMTAYIAFIPQQPVSYTHLTLPTILRV